VKLTDQTEYRHQASVICNKLMQNNLTDKVALVTGASRGVGAKVSETLAKAGADVILNYRSKGHRAETVAETIRSHGRKALLSQADITNQEQMARMMLEAKETFGRLDILILNASGGMETGKADNYAMQLNHDAQLQTVDLALPLMRPGSRIVFVTSHLAHFHGEQPVLPEYEPVAASKRAGETALRNRIPQLTDKGISLIVVSGDLIEGTITPKLLQRARPGLIEQRREQAGELPTVQDFAQAIVDAATDSALSPGDTIYVGETN